MLEFVTMEDDEFVPIEFYWRLNLRDGTTITDQKIVVSWLCGNVLIPNVLSHEAIWLVWTPIKGYRLYARNSNFSLVKKGVQHKLKADGELDYVGTSNHRADPATLLAFSYLYG